MSKYRSKLWKVAKGMIGFLSGNFVAGVLFQIDFIGVWALLPGIVSGYVVYRLLPDSGVEAANQQMEDLPSLERLETELQKVNSNDPEATAEALSFVNPDDVADAILILEPGAGSLSINQLNHLAHIIAAGIQLPSDPEEVLAQLKRMETTKDPTNLVYNALFNLYDAAQLGKVGKIFKIMKIWAIKNREGLVYGTAAGLSIIGASKTGSSFRQNAEEEFGELEEDEIAGQDVLARMLAMGTAETFSRLVAPPREYHTQLISVTNDTDERDDTRGSAAVVLGGIGRKYPDLSGRITEEIRPLINDKGRECRLLAVEALAGPAVHHKAAADILEAIVMGEKREFALDNALQERAQKILNGKDPYSYQPSDSSGQNSGESDGDDDLSI